jgi:hypothetical protein
MMKKFLFAGMLLFNSTFILTAQQSWFVTSASDEGEGSLRNILQQTVAYDTIRFAGGIDTIYLTSGELTIDRSLFIMGNENKTFIKRDVNSPVFRLIKIESEDSIRILFNKMGFSGGSAPKGTETTINGENGGAILVSDSVHFLSLESCNFISNCSGDGVSEAWNGEYYAGKGGHGGAIYTNSKLLLEDCSFLNNFCGTGGQCHQIQWDWYILIGEDGGSGGAIFCTSILEMENCLFESNRAGNGRSALGSGSDYVHAEAGQGGDGGAVVMNGDSLVVTNCEFLDNKAGTGGSARSNDSGSTKKGGDGGALCITGAYASISYSLFTGNYSGTGGSVPETGGSGGYGKNGGDGGAVSLKESILMITSTDFIGNQTGNGGLGDQNYLGDGGNGGNGGAFFAGNSEFHMLDCQIMENKTGNGGKGPGGMNSEFEMNGGSGGGIMIHSASNNCSLKNCTITNNTSGNGGEHLGMRPGASGGHGGGIAFIETPGSVTLNLINCDISLNKSGFAYVPEESYYGIVYPRGGSGGGIYCPGGGISLVNVTCTGNKAGSAYFTEISATDTAIIFQAIRGFGGGMFDTTATNSMINSLFAFNKIYTDSIPSENDLEGSFNINYSLVMGNDGFNFTGNHNLFNVDPLFLDFPDSRMLKEESPAVDAGNPDTNNFNLPLVDLIGTPRILNAIIDMGAYEHLPGSGIGDESVQRLKFKVQSYPNPFRSSTVIEYELPDDAKVELVIYNYLGQVVDVLWDARQNKGHHTLNWDALKFPPGIYTYMLTSIPALSKSKIQNLTGKLILAK